MVDVQAFFAGDDDALEVELWGLWQVCALCCDLVLMCLHAYASLALLKIPHHHCIANAAMETLVYSSV